MLRDNSRQVGLPACCIYAVDGHSDRWLEIKKVWISYISKKGQR